MSRTTHAVGHTYWEYRMDVHLGRRFAAGAREVVLRHNHAEADELFDRVLSRTLFSFRTNRRIFRGMIAFQDDELWKKVFDEILRRSRFDLPERTRDRYLLMSFDYVMEFLEAPASARASILDPIGDSNLKLAKSARREALTPGGRGEDLMLMRELADQVFPLPTSPLIYVPRATNVDVPGFPPINPEEAPPKDETPFPGPPSLATPS